MSETLPLSTFQKLQLAFECLPFVGCLVALFMVTFREDITGSFSPLARLLMGLAVIVFGMQAFNRVRDLLSGVLIVCEDSLERTCSLHHPFIRFTQIGRARLTWRARREGRPGQRYEVYYSPASKVVWKLEALRPQLL